MSDINTDEGSDAVVDGAVHQPRVLLTRSDVVQAPAADLVRYKSNYNTKDDTKTRCKIERAPMTHTQVGLMQWARWDLNPEPSR